MGIVRIGTSGFSYADWKGVFYPELISKDQMLAYYSKIFDAVEINATYYAILRPQVFEKMLLKVPEDFHFAVKAHKSITHENGGGVTEC